MGEHQPIGTLINVAGYKLHAYGMGDGEPIAVMISGMGNDCLIWQLVQPRVAEFTGTIAYDRAGLGWSEPTGNPRTPDFIAKELHQLLKESGTKAPYVLVGHSMGGIYAREYARQYPDEVAGMVLIDSPHEELNLRLSERVREADRVQESAMIQQLRDMLELMTQMSHEEFIEKFKAPPEQASPFPKEIVALQRDRVRPKTLQAMIEEAEAMEANISRYRDRTFSLGSKPLAILTAVEMQVDPQLTDAENKEADRVVKELQSELLELSTNSKQIMVEDSSHFIQQEQPQLVIDTIREIVESVRQSSIGAM